MGFVEFEMESEGVSLTHTKVGKKRERGNKFRVLFFKLTTK